MCGDTKPSYGHPPAKLSRSPYDKRSWPGYPGQLLCKSRMMTGRDLASYRFCGERQEGWDRNEETFKDQMDSLSFGASPCHVHAFGLYRGQYAGKRHQAKDRAGRRSRGYRCFQRTGYGGHGGGKVPDRRYGRLLHSAHRIGPEPGYAEFSSAGPHRRQDHHLCIPVSLWLDGHQRSGRHAGIRKSRAQQHQQDQQQGIDRQYGSGDGDHDVQHRNPGVSGDSLLDG